MCPLSSIRLLLCGLVLHLTLGALTSQAGDRGVIFFERKVRPILVESCYECHSVESGESKGDLLLDTREGVLKGGELGPAIVPGDAEDSLLYQSVTYTDDYLEMPPKKRLTANEIKTLKKWIDMGAPDPRKSHDEKKMAEKAEIDFEKAREHWSFRPLDESPLPEVADRKWPLQSIDHYILARLEKEEILPTHRADPAVLMRRLYFDLIGLPPSIEQQDAFLNAAEKDFDAAYTALVDQLLASPHFGERWARHWLDVVHYGETYGNPRNFVNPLMWKYRDYVIDAYNQDKPYDIFIKEQIAGDLLPAYDLEQRREQLVATGMLLTGQRAFTGENASENAAEDHADDIDDQLNVIGHAIMGLSIACARCHDHKFDPIPTHDYYALAGILRNTSAMNLNVIPEIYAKSNTSLPRQASARYVAMPEETEDLEEQGAILAKISKAEMSLRRHHSDLERYKELIEKDKATEDDLPAIQEKIDKTNQNLTKLKAQQSGEIKHEMVAAVADLPDLVDQPLFIKGDSANHGDIVPRGFLQVLPVTAKDLTIPASESGRVQLAEWLVALENAIVYRVYANRIWKHLFGVGIVESVDNFGITGQSPSHPQLLDHLALTLQQNDFSTKSLIRSLVLSRTYRLSSDPNDTGLAKDPGSRLRWRMMPRRLEAEVIRDTALQASQQLVIGSPGPSHAASFGAHLAGDAEVDFDIPQRSIYLSILRENVPHQLAVFDFPDPAFIRGARTTNNTPTQALFLMNSEFIRKASRKVGAFLIDREPTAPERAELAIRTILGRPAKPEETAHLVAFVDQSLADRETATTAWARVSQLLFSSTEFRHVW